MKKLDTENLHRLFRYHGNVQGIARTTVMALRAMIAAIEQLDCEKKDIMECYLELATAIRETEPRIIPLIHMLEQFEAEIEPFLEEDTETLRATAVKIFKQKIALYESRVELVVRNGLTHVEDKDSIVVHSASSVVNRILIQARQVMLKEINVIVLQLDPVRTPQIALILSEADIPHIVIPEFNLCHYCGQANKIFVGALTITRDHKVVAPVGTANTLSLCKANGIRSYLFANSFHFSHGLAASQRIHTEHTDVAQARSRYRLTTHSHDLVDMDFFDVVVDETGVMESKGG